MPTTIACSHEEAVVVCRYWLNRMACLESIRLDRPLTSDERNELTSAERRACELAVVSGMTLEEAKCYMRRVLNYLAADKDNPATPPWEQILLTDFGIFFGLPL